jgi:hypothetical protein
MAGMANTIRSVRSLICAPFEVIGEPYGSSARMPDSIVAFSCVSKQTFF